MNLPNMNRVELTETDKAAMNVLQMIQHKEFMRRAREEALRAQHINENEITG